MTYEILYEINKIFLYVYTRQGVNGETGLYCHPYRKVFIYKVYTEANNESRVTQDLKKACDNRYQCLLSTFPSYLQYSPNYPLEIHYYCSSRNFQGLYNFFDTHLVHNVNEQTGNFEYCQHKISKRQDKNVINREPGGIFRLEDVINMYRGLGDARAFGYESETFIPSPQNATRYVVTRRVQPNNQPLFSVPIYVAATIRYHHTQNQRPSSIPENVRSQLTRMNALGDDDAGHILAHSLGGPTIPRNFVPMNRDLNRIRGNWFRTENVLRAYLNNERQGYIDWEALVIYPDGFRNYRPIGFIVRYTLFDGHGQQIGDPEIRTFLNDREHFQNGECTHGLKDFFMEQ